jgi:GGDEF domain-containing protein
MNDLNLFEPKLPRAALVWVHLLGILIIVLFGLYHLLYDSLIMSAFCFGALIFTASSLFAAVNNSETSIFLLGFVLSIAMLTFVASYLYGEKGLIYCFSVPAVMFFMMAFRAAFIGGLILCIVNLILAAPHLEPQMLIRFAVAISLSFALSATFSRQIYKQQVKLEKDANEDYLTGLMNQRSFYRWLTKYLANPLSLHTKLTLFYFDIDDFKSVNDSFGHEGGDRVLKEFSERIKTCVGQLDLKFCVDTNMYFCRLAGDEFVLACPNTDSRATATKVANSF